MKTNFFLAAILIALVIVLVPFAVIWSLNTLFGLALAYTFENWAAIVLLQGWMQAMISVGARR